MIKYHHHVVTVTIGDALTQDFYAWPLSMPLPENHVTAFASSDDIPEDCIDLMVNDEEEGSRLLALMIALDEYDLAYSATVFDDHIQIGSREYLVVDDHRADELWDEDLDNYLDDCVLHELPEMAQRYFDREAWKRDARIDGRAHSLASDGDELFEDVGETTWYIYRCN